MDFLDNFGSIIGILLGGGGIGSLLTFGLTRRKGEFDLFQAQLHQMGKELEFERARNHELTEARNKMRDEYEAQLADKTKRLRDLQDHNVELHERLTQLTKDYGELDVRFAMHRCDIVTCPWSEPPKSTSLPIPDNMTKDEWHRRRLAAKSDSDEA